MTHRKPRSTEATRRRRMNKAMERAERAWTTLHRAQLEFEAAWSQMPEAERRSWLDDNDMEHIDSHVHNGAVLFHDCGA